VKLSQPLRIPNMSDWKTKEDQDGRNYLYIEELNSNDGTSRRLAGIKTTQSVKDLKKAIAAELNNPEGWSTISVAFTDKELDNREFELHHCRMDTHIIVQSAQVSLHMH
jgi:hypothetical protein